MALEVVGYGENGEVKLGGIWDYRDDPEGMLFGELDPEKIARVKEFMEQKHAERMQRLGFIYQTENYPK